MSLYMKDAHKRMSRLLGYALTLGTGAAWAGFTLVSGTVLTEAERATLALSILSAMPADQVLRCAAAVLNAAGMPLPSFLGGMDDARLWAACASERERKAVALAAFEAMDRRTQAAFYFHLSEIEFPTEEGDA